MANERQLFAALQDCANAQQTRWAIRLPQPDVDIFQRDVRAVLTTSTQRGASS